MTPSQDADYLTNDRSDHYKQASCGQIFGYLQTKSLNLQEFQITVCNGSLRVLRIHNKKIKMELETLKFHATKAFKTFANFKECQNTGERNGEETK